MSFQKTEKINQEIFDVNPSIEIELLEIYNIAGTSDVLRIHSGASQIKKSIIFDSKEYFYVPFESDSFESRNDGRMPRPTLSIINLESFMTSYVKNKDDLIGAEVKRIRTFLKFLDSDNFLNYASDKSYWDSLGINPDPSSKLRDQYWEINRKVREDKYSIQYELVSPLEVENVQVPRRQIINNYCFFKYRGKGCGYQGDPVSDSNDVKFLDSLNNRGDWVESANYFINDFVRIIVEEGNETREVLYVCTQDHTSDQLNKPTVNVDYWTVDACSKGLSACKMRFKGDHDEQLPFGGFPSSRIL